MHKSITIRNSLLSLVAAIACSSWIAVQAQDKPSSYHGPSAPVIVNVDIGPAIGGVKSRNCNEAHDTCTRNCDSAGDSLNETIENNGGEENLNRIQEGLGTQLKALALSEKDNCLKACAATLKTCMDGAANFSSMPPIQVPVPSQ